MTGHKARPLSDLVAQGWEILDFASGHSPSGYSEDKFLLRRQRVHKMLTLRKKLFGGYDVKEVEL